MSAYRKLINGSDRKLLKEVKNNNEHICYYCGKHINSPGDLTVDHKKPVSRGGKTIKTNLVIACLHCNWEKDDMNEAEYSLYKQGKLQRTIHTGVNTIELDSIKIPYLFLRCGVKDKKVNKAIDYYQKHRCFEKPILITIHSKLIDGYSRYMAACKLGLEVVNVNVKLS